MGGSEKKSTRSKIAEYHVEWSLYLTGKASEKTSKCLTDMLKSTKNKVFPVVREMNKYNVSVMQLLRRRNNFNYE